MTDLFGRLQWNDLPFVVAIGQPTASNLIAAGAAFVLLAGAAVSLFVLVRKRLLGCCGVTG